MAQSEKHRIGWYCKSDEKPNVKSIFSIFTQASLSNRALLAHSHSGTCSDKQNEPLQTSRCCPYKRTTAAHFSSVTADITMDNFIRALCRLLWFLPQSTALATGSCMCNGAEHTPAGVTQLSQLLAPAQNFCHSQKSAKAPHQGIFMSVLIQAHRSLMYTLFYSY